MIVILSEVSVSHCQKSKISPIYPHLDVLHTVVEIWSNNTVVFSLVAHFTLNRFYTKEVAAAMHLFSSVCLKCPHIACCNTSAPSNPQCADLYFPHFWNGAKTGICHISVWCFKSPKLLVGTSWAPAERGASKGWVTAEAYLVIEWLRLDGILRVKELLAQAGCGEAERCMEISKFWMSCKFRNAASQIILLLYFYCLSFLIPLLPSDHLFVKITVDKALVHKNTLAYYCQYISEFQMRSCLVRFQVTSSTGSMLNIEACTWSLSFACALPYLMSSVHISHAVIPFSQVCTDTLVYLWNSASVWFSGSSVPCTGVCRNSRIEPGPKSWLWLWAPGYASV